jgi:hypothetical protein
MPIAPAEPIRSSLYRPSLALEAVETATLNYNRLRFLDGSALFRRASNSHC